MRFESARGGELAQLVADHFFCHVHVHVGPAVVDQERVSDEFRGDRRTTRPGLNRILPLDRFQTCNLHQQRLLDKRAFFG